MIDLQRTDRAREVRHGGKRHRRAVRCLQEDTVEIVGALLEFRFGLEDDLIIVRWRIDGRHLTRSEGVVKLLTNLVDRDPVDGRFLAIDLDRYLRVLHVKVGRDIEQSRDLRDLVAQLRRDAIEILGVV